MPPQNEGAESRRRFAREVGTGLVQVYTGDGKGKTTAALGLALRASGQGLRVCVLQFLKGGFVGGEHRFVQRQSAFTILMPNQHDFFTQSDDERRAAAATTLEMARELVRSLRYDLVVLDEVLTAASLGLIATKEVLELISQKRVDLELVLTGRGAHSDIIQAADLATEMVPLKHPYDDGVGARRGIEY